MAMLTVIPVTCGVAVWALKRRVQLKRRFPFVTVALQSTSRAVWPPRSPKSGTYVFLLSSFIRAVARSWPLLMPLWQPGKL